MVDVIFLDKFKKIFSKIKEPLLKEKIIKQIQKIKENPQVGKPMRNVRKGMRELYLKPYRLSYIYLQQKNTVYMLDLYHKKSQ